MANIFIKSGFVLYVLLIIKNNVDGASLNGEKNNENVGLYNADDKVHILNVSNFKENVYGKPYAQVIEFYSSWCGHCQRFAPIWKKIAKEANIWRDIFVISAIDCANEINTPICREFEVMGYPSIRFFHMNYESGENKIGEVIQVNHDVNILKRSLIIKLIEEEKNNRGVGWPLLTEYSKPNVMDAWDNVSSTVKHVFLIIDQTDSYLGAEIALDVHVIPEIAIKIVSADNVKLNILLGITQLPSLLVVNRDFTTIPLTPRKKDKYSFEFAIKIFCESKNIEWPSELLLEENLINVENPDDMKNHFDRDLKDKINRMGDVVFQIDLENALHTSLKSDIIKINKISGETLLALRNYLTVLTKYFPFGENGIKFLKSLKEKIDAVDEISGNELSRHINELEERWQPIYSSPLQWLGCRGSSPVRRGYPCGMWILFHYLTVNSVEQNHDKDTFDSKEVLNAILGFVKHFFGCRHCSQHFQEMAVRNHMTRVNDPDNSILWLWKAHNEVNQRLSGDATEDPEFPKIQFPRQSRCQQCYRSDDGKWDELEVLKYLKKVYDKNNIKYFVNSADSFQQSSSTASKQSWNILSDFDVGNVTKNV